MPAAVTNRAKTVLVVDDDPIVVRLMVQLLELNHYTPITATQYTEAVEVLGQTVPDLILLDLSMPHVDGGTLLEFLREQGLQVPVIVVSGYLDGKVATQLSGYDVSSFIWKPFNISDLTDAIRKAIGPAGEPSDDVVAAELVTHVDTAPEPESGSVGDLIVEGESESGDEIGILHPVLPVISSSEGSSDPDTGTRGHWVRRRRRHKPKWSRRRRVMYMGAVTVLSVGIAFAINFTRSYMNAVEMDEMRSGAAKSIKEQILDELRKDQILEDLRKKASK